MAKAWGGGCFVFKGAEDADIKFIQKILDGYKGKPYSGPEYGDGKVIMTDSPGKPEEYGIEFDLGGDGIIKIKGDSREGSVLYDAPDRNVLIEQLILMFSGNRFQDSDYADLMPVFEAGCRFRHAECENGHVREQTEKLLKDVLQEPGSKEVILQITGGDPAEAALAMAELDIDTKLFKVVPQIIMIEPGKDNFVIAVFSTEKG